MEPEAAKIKNFKFRSPLEVFHLSYRKCKEVITELFSLGLTAMFSLHY